MALLSKYERQGLLHSIKVAKFGLTVSHLLFAYDSLFFLHANVDEATRLKTILTIYEIASG